MKQLIIRHDPLSGGMELWLENDRVPVRVLDFNFTDTDITTIDGDYSVNGGNKMKMTVEFIKEYPPVMEIITAEKKE